ncbi:hypothetical protein CDAR_166671 [Caerostris darwini]|uniref:Uncharacterized protein n=1 Tax=Caerostris darwini TaxID=1538125 RepID=A0AAV4QP24_9ARAC|nr:hypothetical protein CDAR_166671 [Caerostris darwini]
MMTVGRGRKTEKTTKYPGRQRRQPGCALLSEGITFGRQRRRPLVETSESSALDDRVAPCWNEKTTGETYDDQVVPCIEIKSTGKHST